MRIKRFITADIRSGLRKVSETLGPDAVILSNNRVEGGIEIVAAIEYDDGDAHSADEISAAVKESETYNELDIQQTAGEIKIQADQSQREAALDDIRFARNIQPSKTREQETIIKPLNSFSAKVSVADDNKQHMWTEEPAFMEMKSELKSLRGLLVNQLSNLSWGKETKYHPLRARLLQRLTSLGLSTTFSREIASTINEQRDFEHNWRLALGELSHRVPVGENAILEKGGIVALVGATGVGKTTTIAKLAARYTLKHGPHKVALITTDNYRVAAHEQLRSYARIMGVPMRVAGDAESLREAFDSLQDKELILIDTAGMSQRDMLLNKQFEMLRAEGLPPIHTYLTLATNCQRAVLRETGAKFKDMNLDGCILTKVDETSSLGGAIMVAIENELPISYICDGQKVPEDMHLARALSIVSRSVSIMQHMESQNYDEDLLLNTGGMTANGHG